MRCSRSLKKKSAFHAILLDFQKEVSDIWDKLPQDTLIAALLDPRFKSLNHVKSQLEKDEAWQCLTAEYEKYKDKISPKIVPISPPVNSNTKKNGTAFDFFAKKSQTVLTNEIERWKHVVEIEMTEDPLAWWKFNEKSFPVLGYLAKMYLAVPASQATCERSFSTSRRIVTFDRASLKPDNVEMLTMMKQNANDLYTDDV